MCVTATWLCNLLWTSTIAFASNSNFSSMYVWMYSLRNIAKLSEPPIHCGMPLIEDKSILRTTQVSSLDRNVSTSLVLATNHGTGPFSLAYEKIYDLLPSEWQMTYQFNFGGRPMCQ